MEKEKTVDELANAPENKSLDLVSETLSIVGREGGEGDAGKGKPSAMDVLNARKLGGGKREPVQKTETPEEKKQAEEQAAADAKEKEAAEAKRKQEEAAAAGDPEAKKKLEAEAAETAEKVKLAEELEGIAAKMEKGEELTPYERTLLKLVEKDLPPSETPVFRIGTETLTRDQALERMRADNDLKGGELTEAQEERVLQVWFKSQNKTELSRSTQRDAQLNAEARKTTIRDDEANQAKARELAAREEATRLKEERIKIERESLKTQRERITRLAAKAKEESLAGDDEDNAVERRMAAQRVKELAEELSEAETREAELEKASITAIRERAVADVDRFILNHPEYQVEGRTVHEVFTDLQDQEKRKSVPEGDKLKVLELQTIFRQANVDKVDAEDVHLLLSKQGKIAVKRGAAQSQSPDPAAANPEDLKRNSALSERIRRHTERMKGASPTPGAGGGGPQSRGADTGVKTTAAKMVEESREILKTGAEDTFLKKEGWT